MHSLFEICALLVPLIHLVGILTAADALYLSRSSQSAIAWGISLATFPYLALPFYWIFGRRRFMGYRERLRQFSDLHKTGLAAYRRSFDEFISATPPLERAAERSFETIAQGQFKSGNRVDLLINAEQTFPSLLAGIRSAKRYILFQSFIVRDDQIGREIQGALMEAAQAGVKVHFLYDEIGCNTLANSYLQGMAEAGVHVAPFATRQGLGNFFQFNFRNHRKNVVIDGNVAFVGGLNIGDEYCGKDPQFGKWRDTHLRIEGPAVLPIQAVFVEDWFWATQQPPQLEWRSVSSAGSKDLLTIASGPVDERERCLLFFLEIIRSAKERLWIATPYFVPDESIMRELQLATLRGVDVRLIVPQRPDHYLVWLAGFSYIAEASGFGVRIFRYKPGFMHQKVVAVDDTLVAVGTANLDNRSLRLNFEIMVLGADLDLNKQVVQMLEEDMSQSLEGPLIFDELPLARKLQAKFARLFAPIL